MYIHMCIYIYIYIFIYTHIYTSATLAQQAVVVCPASLCGNWRAEVL